ncbi:oxysterol-binding protein-related protein 3-like isoform X1 [Polyodon spathula]|uniref:oxysterol-binding protein-related protein 3-like isoform X1 n=1 Tax=Polyodon spathula TaxID=7913 RepID=UPI001B7F0D8F|nr:oxysterol-binding protein-related protein 3-like isoform X1 [Polyodon spathula]
MNSDNRNVTMPQKVSSPSRSNSSCSSKQESRQDSWEIVEGLRGGGGNIQEPQKQKGFLLKRRKWPLKGWHKRYFFLEKGILKYAKSEADIDKGKLHGCIDVGLSVMAIKEKAKCIDLDAEEHIYHLKIKSQELFDEWVSKLRHHRLYRQNEITMFPLDKNNHFFSHFPPDEPPNPSNSSSSSLRKRATIAKQASIHTGGNFPLSFNSSQGKVSACLQSSEDMDKCSTELTLCQSHLLELSHLLQSMEVLHRTHSAPAISVLQASTFESPKKEKRTQKRWRTKGYGKDAKTTLQVPSCTSPGSIRLHASNPNLSTVGHSNDKSYSENTVSPSDPSKLLEDFYHVANNLHSTLKSAFSIITTERGKLKQTLDCEAGQPPSTQMVGLKNSLASQDPIDGCRPLEHQVSSESKNSITESLSEFFDAQEVLLSASSSENEASDDESYISDISDNISVDNLSNDVESCVQNGSPQQLRRRFCLPAPGPDTSNISLWNILRNNIGKDLSKVAMPVQLNEPLNTLQRLCEELEYSELLDMAAETQDPFQRMVYIATFAISAYASSYYRAGSKPFNPVLGETYECEREDKGFRFIAEQVSHHPPISACHTESENFVFWQDMRWKNKFWGKSMEIVPVGTTHVMLPKFGDHYEWNKITSCIHNILSGQRWIEHYGEISIKNSNSDVCQCKVTFIKAKYWNSDVNGVEGTITDRSGKVVQRLFGKWHEGVYCGVPPSANCVWRPDPMPNNFEQYYGFTKFALELNELDPATKLLLPPTDTRFRQDQRLLEEGNVELAEEQKQRIEQLQRERRRVLEENNMSHQPRFFRKSSEDTWVSKQTYWDLRKDPGFANLDNPVLW